MGWKAWCSVHGSDSKILLLFKYPDTLGAHSASHSMGTAGSFLMVQQSGHENDHTPLSNSDIKNEWRDTSTPLICLHSMTMDLTFIAEIYPQTIMKNLTVVPMCHKENPHLIYKNIFLSFFQFIQNQKMF